jgi:hypothetical protein
VELIFANRKIIKLLKRRGEAIIKSDVDEIKALSS